MAKEMFDVAVIGGGPGGYVAAIRAAQLGAKTVCIEKEATYGGTCLNVGCIPSKALLQSSEYYSLLKNPQGVSEHGISVKESTFDFGKMQERKDRIIQGLVEGVSGLLKRNKVTICNGTARFMNPNCVTVADGQDNKEIEAKAFILATGSEPIGLPFLPFDEKHVLSSTGALGLKTPPKKMLLVGAGVIGVELASVYNRLGTEVVILEMLDRICPTMDKAISKMLLQILKNQGLTFHLGAKVVKAEISGDNVNLSVEVGGNSEVFSADAVLVAIGRRPYSKGLGLQEIGIAMTPQGFVRVDGNFRTNLPHLLAIGDLIEGPMLAHRASEEGVAAAEIIAGLHPHINYAAIPSVIYTHPEAASVGFTEEEATAFGLSIKVGRSLFKANPRARCLGDTEGMVKVIGDAKTDRLIGVHIIGPSASELIAEGVVAIENGCTLTEMARTSHAHPTLSESILEAVLSALGRPLHS